MATATRYRAQVKKKTGKHATSRAKAPSGATKRRSAPKSTQVKPSKRGSKVEAWTDNIKGDMFDDDTVAEALASLVDVPYMYARELMCRWKKRILKVQLPGKDGRPPADSSLRFAKKQVIKFFEQEQALGKLSDVQEAFNFVAGEELTLHWEEAKSRVLRAKLDKSRRIDRWTDTFAMQQGESNAKCEIYICGTRPITQSALQSILCHEGLHNLARRNRRGNPYLSEDLEHLAMAFLGDPQLAS